MNRREALTALKNHGVPAKDAVRALPYAEATRLATGIVKGTAKHYAVRYSHGAYTVEVK